MEVTIKTTKTVNAKLLQVEAKVRYWEDATINGVEDTEGTLTPCASGEMWRPLIDIETGKILNWEQGKKAEIHFKVCDCCGWHLLDDEHHVILSEEGDYVPDTLCPADNGYGDYIIMNIDETGTIEDWDFDINDFQKEDED